MEQLLVAGLPLWNSLGFEPPEDPQKTPGGITTISHKLARLVYRILPYGEQYIDKGMIYYEEKYPEHELQVIHNAAKELGFEFALSPATA